MKTLREVFAPYEKEIVDLISKKQIGRDPERFILDQVQWMNSDNRFQLIGNDYEMRERTNDRDGSKVIIRIDYKDEVLRLSEIFLTQPKRGTGKILINLLIKICKENNITKFEVYSTNEKSASLCEKMGLTKEENSTNYFIRID